MLDLGIEGRRAIVCASSRGLGRACATSLARAGVELVINGLDEARLAATAAAIRQETGVKVTAIAADVTTKDGQAKLLAALPDPDILVTNAGGPPFKDFRELARDDLDRRDLEHGHADRADSGDDRRHGRAPLRADRQHHLDLGAHAGPGPGPVVRRARRADRVPRRRRPLGRARWRHDQQHPAGLLRHRSLLGGRRGDRQGPGQDPRAVRERARGHRADAADRQSGRARRRLRLPVQRPRRLHHRPEPPPRRRPVQQRVLTSNAAIARGAASRTLDYGLRQRADQRRPDRPPHPDLPLDIS